MRFRLSEEWAAFRLAAQFLTRLPIPADWSEALMPATPRWYPAVGLLLGLAVGLVFALASQFLSPALAAILATAAGALLTGALHEDGLADLCDGLGGATAPERSLEIMRDSRIGTYGVLGLGLVLAAKIAALASFGPLMGFAALVAGHAASRASVSLVIATSSYVRTEGAGASVAAARPGLWPVWAVSAAALIPLALVAGAAALVLAMLGLLAGHVVLRRIFERRLGGYTGDCLGAVQQVSEIGLYLGLAGALGVS